MLSDRELRERLKAEGDAAKVHELISHLGAAQIGGLRCICATCCTFAPNAETTAA
jgi:hypothetical protein